MSATFEDLKPGMVIGSYRVEVELGRGGMGTVYRASHTLLPRRVAIKVMHPELCQSPGMASRVIQEAALVEDLRHPGLVRVFDCNLLPDHRPYIIMELVEGETLTARIQRGRLPWLEVASLLADVADVLAVVHRHGVVHRDLKPDNLLLTPGDPDFALRVIDWGVARLSPAGRLTLDGLTPGTPLYMSPEQATGHHISAPCDVYSLGVIAYEALCGQPPFDGRTVGEVVCKHLTTEAVPLRTRCTAPAELCELVHRMLDKDPAARPMAVDVRTLAQALVRDRATLTIEEPVEVVDIDIDTEVIDPEDLERGVTELLPGMRKLRWTPQVNVVTRNHVSGEVVARRHR